MPVSQPIRGAYLNLNGAAAADWACRNAEAAAVPRNARRLLVISVSCLLRFDRRVLNAELLQVGRVLRRIVAELLERWPESLHFFPVQFAGRFRLRRYQR